MAALEAASSPSGAGEDRVVYQLARQRQGLTGYFNEPAAAPGATTGAPRTGAVQPTFIFKPGWQRCKPSSVPPVRRASGFGGEGHLSGPAFADGLCPMGKRPTRDDKVEPDLAAAWPCTRWGLPCRRHRCRRGALLPHHFTLTDAASPSRGTGPDPIGQAEAVGGAGGVFSVALSLSAAGCPKPAPDGGRYPPPRLSGARTFLPPPQGRGAAFHATSHEALYQRLRLQAIDFRVKARAIASK